MAHMSVLDYALMVEDSHVESGVVEYRRRGPDSAITGRDEGDIVACALTDVLADGLSMVYSFFDPELADRSLGTFMILEHIERARKLGKPYVYLGYWVDGSPKMDYKAPLPAAGAADAEGLGQGGVIATGRRPKPVTRTHAPLPSPDRPGSKRRI